MKPLNSMYRAVCFALALVACPSVAATEEDRARFCAVVSEVAEVIMRDRQDGAPMIELMNRATSDLTREIITEAYGRQRWNGEKMQQREVENFRDYWAHACYST